ncbi:hypothetical protein [Nonomuraea endophytica]
MNRPPCRALALALTAAFTTAAVPGPAHGLHPSPAPQAPPIPRSAP